MPAGLVEPTNITTSFVSTLNAFQRAIKNRHRLIRDNAVNEPAAAAVIECDKLMMRDMPFQWREKVAGCLHSASKNANRLQVKQLKAEAKSYDRTESVNDVLDVDEMIRMKRRHYLKHFKKWECSDSEDCKKLGNISFDEMHAAQEGEEDSSDESAVRFRNPKQKRQIITGVSSRNGVEQKASCTDEHKNVLKRKLKRLAMPFNGGNDEAAVKDESSAHASARHYPRQSIDGDSAGKRSSSKRSLLTSLGTDDLSGCAGTSDDEQANTKRTRSSASGRASSAGSAPTTAAPQKPHFKGKPLSDPMFESNRPPEKWTSVEFLQAKSHIKYCTAVELGRISGKQGMLQSMKHLLAKADAKDCVYSDLTIKPEELLGKIVAAGKKADLLDKEAINARKSNYLDIKSQLLSMRTAIDEVKADYDDVTLAMQFKLAEAVKNSSVDYQKKFWEYTKVAQRLKRGGHSEGEAKYKGKVICAYNRHAELNDDFSWDSWVGTAVGKNPELATFDHTTACFFYNGAEDAPVEVVDVFHDQLEYIEAKGAKLAVTMAENPRWVGACGVLEIRMDPDQFVLLKKGVSTAEGGRANLMCFQNNAKRSGPTAIPFTGQAMVFYGCQETIVWIQIFPISQFLVPPHNSSRYALPNE